jgi:lipoprotein-anchoring transpeptidase ErfK/SrfK
MGGAHSNGCIRIPNEVIEQLADTVPIGTPVDIVA